jgi:hypothetical protein
MLSTKPCRAEIGRPGHWHECGKRSVVKSIRRIGNTEYDLEFCEQHKDRAYKGSRVVTIVRVEVLS